jgi:Ferritin-like domain
MAGKGIMRGTVAASLVALLALAGCGGGGGSAPLAQREKESDIDYVDNAIARELATVDAYAHGLALPGRADAALLRQLRAQAQEHVDALTKAVRGLGGAVDPEKVAAEREALDYTGVKSRADFLVFAYERESRGVAGDLTEIARLASPWPRSLLGSIAANQAQHLVLLRQALGDSPLASVPEPFEAGATPPP